LRRRTRGFNRSVPSTYPTTGFGELDPATQPKFILYLLNNKEMHKEMTRKLIEKEEMQIGDNSNSEHSEEHHLGGVAPNEVKKKLNKMNESRTASTSTRFDIPSALQVRKSSAEQHRFSR
jgi:hypothetical protein